MVSRLGIVAAILLPPNLLGGCLALSSAWAYTSRSDLADSPSGVDYALVKVTPATSGFWRSMGAIHFGDLRRAAPLGVPIGDRDVLSVTIFEAAAGVFHTDPRRVSGPEISYRYPINLSTLKETLPFRMRGPSRPPEERPPRWKRSISSKRSRTAPLNRRQSWPWSIRTHL